MATKNNIIYISVLILILIILWMFMTPRYIEGLDGPHVLGTEFKPKQGQTIHAPVELVKNWGLSFTVKLNGVVKDGNWHQMIGITPNQDGNDERFFAAWFRPNTSQLYFKTYTVTNWDAEIIDGFPIEVGKQYRFDVFASMVGDRGDKQNIIVNMTNFATNQTKQIANVMLDAPRFISKSKSGFGSDTFKPDQVDTKQVYVFSTYKNSPPFNGTLRDVVFTVGSEPIVTSNLIDAINKNRADAVVVQAREQVELAARETNRAQAQAQPRAQALPQQQPLPQQLGSLSSVFGGAFGGGAFGSLGIQRFTTMTESATQEGLTNIGGLGNNGYIPGITPPTASTTTIAPAVNYKPIPAADGIQKLCERSVVQNTDPSYNWISQYGYNYPIEFGANSTVTKSVPICSPDDLYTIQTRILKELNDFNAAYSDYMTYRYNKWHNETEHDSSPTLKFASGITQTTAESKYSYATSPLDLNEYKTLDEHLQTYNDLLTANRAYYPNPENSGDPKTDLKRMDPIILGQNHAAIIKQRNALDAKLFELNNIQNSVAGESKMQMDSSIYVTLLWTTLATSIIYFMFV